MRPCRGKARAERFAKVLPFRERQLLQPLRGGERFDRLGAQTVFRHRAQRGKHRAAERLGVLFPQPGRKKPERRVRSRRRRAARDRRARQRFLHALFQHGAAAVHRRGERSKARARPFARARADDTEIHARAVRLRRRDAHRFRRRLFHPAIPRVRGERVPGGDGGERLVQQREHFSARIRPGADDGKRVRRGHGLLRLAAPGGVAAGEKHAEKRTIRRAAVRYGRGRFLRAGKERVEQRFRAAQQLLRRVRRRGETPHRPRGAHRERECRRRAGILYVHDLRAGRLVREIRRPSAGNAQPLDALCPEARERFAHGGQRGGFAHGKAAAHREHKHGEQQPHNVSIQFFHLGLSPSPQNNLQRKYMRG